MKVSEIVVYTYGDSNSAKTWSNVPYFLVNTLIEKGYTVHQVNILKFNFIQKVFNKLCRTINKDTGIEFSRLPLNAKIVKKIMNKSIAQYPSADLLISTNFSFSPASVCDDVPSLMLCDWTFEYLIRHFKKREPTRLEKKEIVRQDQEIRKSDYVVTLFPQIKEDMEQYYNSNNIYYLGNVLNTAVEPDDLADAEKKYHHKKILFVGQKKYMDSLLAIIEAVKRYNVDEIDRIHLDVIGIGNIPEVEGNDDITMFGYLDKTREEEKAKYYRLLSDASLCINTSENWGGFSSIIEAMYFYTPVVTSEYGEFVNTFGKQIDFGCYCENNVEDIIKAFQEILNSEKDEYIEKCKNAHNAVKQFTWSSYVDRMIELVEQ